MASLSYSACGKERSWPRGCFSTTFTEEWTNPNLKSLIFWFARSAKSLPKQPAAVTTSRLSGAAAMCCVSWRQCRPRPQGARQPDQIEHQPSVRDRPIGRLHVSRIGHGAKPTCASFPVDVRFEDAATTDGGPSRVPQPDPVGSLFGCASARCCE